MEDKFKELKGFIKRIEEDTNLDLNLKGQYLSDMRDIVEDLIFDNDCDVYVQEEYHCPPQN